MTMSDGGKGSAPRPFSVSHDEYASRWEQIFGHKKVTESAPTVPAEGQEPVEVRDAPKTA